MKQITGFVTLTTIHYSNIRSFHRQDVWRQNHPLQQTTWQRGWWPQRWSIRGRRSAPRQATYERLHGLGQGRATQDSQGVPRYAQLQYQQDSRYVEVYVESNQKPLVC